MNNKNAFSLWSSKSANTCSIGDLDPSKLVKLDPAKCGLEKNPTSTTVYTINDITKIPGYKPPIYKGCFSHNLTQKYVRAGVGGFPVSTTPENNAKMIKNCETMARDKKFKYFGVGRNGSECQFSNDDRYIPEKADRTEPTCGAFWWDPDSRVYQVDYGSEQNKFPTDSDVYA